MGQEILFCRRLQNKMSSRYKGNLNMRDYAQKLCSHFLLFMTYMKFQRAFPVKVHTCNENIFYYILFHSDKKLIRGIETFLSIVANKCSASRKLPKFAECDLSLSDQVQSATRSCHGEDECSPQKRYLLKMSFRSNFLPVHVS